jgi:hypothetical protein
MEREMAEVVLIWLVTVLYGMGMYAWGFSKGVAKARGE